MIVIVMVYDKSRDGDDNYSHDYDNNSDDDDDDNSSSDWMISFSDQRTSTITNIMIFHICCSYMMKYGW